MHDGAVVEVLQGRHVLHPPDAAVVHGLHLLPGEGILLVGVHLGQNTGKHGDEKQVTTQKLIRREAGKTEKDRSSPGLREKGGGRRL